MNKLVDANRLEGARQLLQRGIGQSAKDIQVLQRWDVAETSAGREEDVGR